MSADTFLEANPPRDGENHAQHGGGGSAEEAAAQGIAEMSEKFRVSGDLCVPVDR